MQPAEGAQAPQQPQPKKRGGARPGSGPKPADGAAGTRRVQLTLDASTLQLFALLGGGNVSLGARAAARLAAKHAGSLASTHPPTAGV